MTVTITAADEPQACVDKASPRRATHAHGVIAIADAEHNADAAGRLRQSRRCVRRSSVHGVGDTALVYVGAADFSRNGVTDRRWISSSTRSATRSVGRTAATTNRRASRIASALDLMSNSAAPREVDPDRRDGPDTLAINRLAAGWMPSSAVVAIPSSGGTVDARPSNGPSGTRLAVVPLDDHRFLTVELLTAEGFDDHLPASGVAVH